MQEKDQQYLSAESLKNESFSSNTHNTELLAEERRVPAGIEFEVPDRYDIDTLVFLPVNLETSFVYWEITQKLLQAYHIGIDRLRTKVVAVDESGEEELSEFQTSTELGKFYLHFKAPMRRVLARMGFYDENGRFVVLLTSNTFLMPGDTIEFSDDEVWMSIDENTREIIKASLDKSSSTLSSKSIFEEKVTELTKLRGFSSGDLTKRGQ